MSGAPARVLSGRRVFRIVWLPGTDQLQGTCYCGAVHDSEDPIELWDWLLAHAERHGGGGPESRPDPDPGGRGPTAPDPRRETVFA